MQAEDLVLGRVKTVAKFYLDVCLPHGEIGRVNIYDISPTYSALIKEMLDSGDVDDSVAGIEGLFIPGQTVRCYVKKAISNDATRPVSQQTKHLSELSLYPELVNKGMTRKYIRVRTHFVGSVDSQEDHGYTIGTGIQGLKCFLPKEAASGPLPLGSVMTFYPIVSDNITFLTSDTSRVLKVTTRIGDPLDLVLDPAAPVHFGCLTPGTWLRATLHKKVGSTLIAKFSDYLITINRAHYRGSDGEYRIGMELVVCLILVDPGTKQLTGSMLPHLLPSASLDNVSTTIICKQLPVGMRLENAVIDRVDKRTIHLAVPGSNTLQAVVRKVQLPTKLAVENLKSKFAPGQKVTCRVIDHDLLENVAIATMKKKLLQLPFLSIEELSPGDLISAVVNRFTKTGVVVRAEDRLNGLIPYLHLADVPLKRPAEKFQRGQKIDCRVLVVDKEANKLILTAKRGLLDGSCPLLGSKEMFECVERGLKDQTLFAAFVVKISERGLLLSGLDELRAWLPRRETGLAPDDVLEATYFRGQVLRVRIVHALNDDDNTETGKPRSKFLVSLKLKGTNEPLGQHRKTQLDSVQVGQLFHAKINKVQNTGLQVKLYSVENSSNDPSTWSTPVGSGFLSFDQLSDFESNCALFSQFMTRLKSGAPLDLDNSVSRSVVVINKAASTVVVSARPSLLHAVSQQQLVETDSEDKDLVDAHTGFVRDFNDLRVGTQWFAWVVNHVDYGIFVQFPSGIRGLAPMRLLTDTRIPKNVALTNLFPMGATVIAKVVELASSEKRRCLVTLRMMDTYFAEEHYVDLAIRSLGNCIQELEWISRRQDSLSGFRIGDLIQFQTETLDTLMVSGQASKAKAEKATSHMVPAIAYLVNTEGIECVAGTTYTGVVSFVDYAANRLEVALSTWLVNSVKNRKTNAASTPRLGQKVSSTTLAFRSRTMAVVALRGHATGCFGIIPARRTFNDVTGGNAWAVGQRNDVTIRQIFNQEGTATPIHLCTLAIYDPITQVPNRSATSKKAKHATYSKEPLTTGDVAVPLVEGEQLSGLQFDRLVGHIAFFQLSTPSKHQVVFCHLINIAQTAKAVRAFQLQPPPTGTVMQQTATVLHTSAQDQRHSASGRGPLSARLPEVSFLEKPLVSVGDLVCAQLIQVHQDYWALHLPGGARGRIHVTAMLHSKQPEPLDLTTKPTGGDKHPNPSLGAKKELGTGLKKNRLITCRIIDKVENQTKDGESGIRAPIYYVSTKPDIVRGGVECWSKRTPTFNTVTEGFIKIRSPNGLLMALTHKDDILVPFSPTMQEHIRLAQIRFRVGDHLFVRPLRMIEDRLVGELVLTEPVEERLVPDDPTDPLVEATHELLHYINEKTKKSQKHTELFMKSVKSAELIIHDHVASVTDHSSSSTSDRPGSKRLPLTQADVIEPLKKSRKSKRSVSESDSFEVKRRRTEADKQTSESSKRPKEAEEFTSPASKISWDIADSTVLQRYADFMLPTDFDSTEKTVFDVESLESKEKQSRSKETIVKESSATAEWRLREKELRKAMLAALTAEEQCLPKGDLRPTTTEEFELAVRNAPSNATCWIAYMTHILSGSDHQSLTEARALAERGLRAIAASAGLEPGEQDIQQARLLSFYLIMEAKELERCTQQQEHMTSLTSSDPILETNEQANRLSQVLSRLVNLDQAPFTRRAIDTLAEIGQFERAEDLARRLIKSSPGDVDRWLSLIKVRFRAGRVAAAREAQRNAASLLRSVHLPRFLTSSARLEFEFGDADRAISLFREQLAAHPKQKIVYEEFIKMLLLAGKPKEARSIRAKATDCLKPHECESLDELFNKDTRTQEQKT